MKNAGWLVLAAVLLGTTGCIGDKVLGDSAIAASAVEQQQLMDRWNATVESTPTNFVWGTGPAFEWPAFEKFPHPTFKGGSVEAYQTFAILLLAFMRNEENFHYLARNRLFDIGLGYRMANGELGETWCFRELVTQFSSETMFGEIPEETRIGLQEIADRLAAVG